LSLVQNQVECHRVRSMDAHAQKMKDRQYGKGENHSSPNDHIENETLLLRIREGDRSAFDPLYNRYYMAVVGFIRNYVDDSDVEDIAQDVFVRVYRKIEGIQSLQAFECYLFRTAKHCSINWLKKKLRVRNLLKIILHSAVEWLDVNPVDSSGELDMWNRLIDRLPEQTRTIIRWFYFEKVSREEIAKRLNVSKSTAYRRIAECRAELMAAAESEKMEISFAGRHDITIHLLQDETEK